MRTGRLEPLWWAACARRLGALIPLLLVACSLPSPPTPAAPRATAPAILEITPAPTQNIDATATAYARVLAQTPTPAGLYTVQAGDTLSGLADAFGSTVDEIMAANGLTDPNALQVGQSLIIPSLLQSSPALDASPVASATLSATVELGGTPTPAADRTATLTGTPVLSATVTVTVTVTVTASISATGTVTATPTLSTP